VGDQDEFRERLASLRLQVEEGAVAIEQQKLLIEQQKRRGQDSAAAESLLKVLEESQALTLDRLQRLLEQNRP
jgi:hypothetical protein